LERIAGFTPDNDKLTEEDISRLLDQGIAELPEKCREVFLLSRNEHLSHRQISERLGISEKTVDDHITRALKKLRTPLSKMATIFLSFFIHQGIRPRRTILS